MEVIEIEVETLSLSQLSARHGWENYSLDNICQFAEKGHFGLYVNVCEITGHSSRKTYKSIDNYINKLISSKSITDGERKEYLELNNKFKNLCQNNSSLLIDLDGYARLATQIEAKIFSAYSYASIEKFRRKLKICGSEINDHFGFKVVDKEWYGLVWMSENQQLEKGKIYLEKIGDDTKYTIITTDNDILSDIITTEQLPLLTVIDNGCSIDKLDSLLPEILQVTSNRGHTRHTYKECISPAYYFLNMVITKEHLVAFVSQIKEFENKYFLKVAQENILKNKNSFFQRGNSFVITFNEQEFILKEIIGLKYLEILLKRPHVLIPVTELYSSVNNIILENNTTVESDCVQQGHDGNQMIYDQVTVKNMKEELTKLKEKMKNAKDNGDIECEEDLYEKINKLNNWLKKHPDYNYKIQQHKNFTKKELERCRTAVKKAIKKAFMKIGKHCNDLENHLKKSISTGINCEYKPEHGIKW